MHELSIVLSVMDTLEDLGREKNLTQISSVTLEFGEVSGVLDKYFTDCWQWAAKKSDLLRGSELIIEKTPAVTMCNACERTYETVAHGRVCPHCGSPDTYLLTGNEMSIREIEAC